MNWKIFSIVCINLACIFFPYNIIGCAGGEPDPYDYYVSFYDKNLSGSKGFEPFYYTNVQFLYDDKEPVDVATITSAEWVTYANNAFSRQDAYDFVVKYARKDLASLYYHLEKNQPLQLPDSVQSNGMTKFFMTGKDLEALGYLLYAKQVEPQVTGGWSAWEPTTRDPEKMTKLIKNGQQLYAVAKNNFIKLRLAYQVVRLAQYSGRFAECIQWHDELVKNNPTKSVLPDLSLSLKAGAMMHLKQRYEAAVLFSQLFSKHEFKRISNYLSFNWSVGRFDEGDRKACLALCPNNLDKANLLGLFALGSNRDELNTLKQIHQLAPRSPLLEILLAREMNKLEEFYYTPSLAFQKGKKTATIAYTEINPKDSTYRVFSNETKAFAVFCQEVAKQKTTSNKGLYSLTAAHALLITADYPASRKWLDETKKSTLTQSLQDQWAMTNLLWTINTTISFDNKFEEQIFPSLQWLEKQAAADMDYAKFYRRLFTDILAPRYEKMGDKMKYLLCIGAADWINQKYIKDGWGNYAGALDKLRNELTAPEIEKLVQLMESKKLNVFEKYIVQHSAFSNNDVYDVAGTTWLRQFNFANAEKWFKKIPAAYYEKEPYSYYLAGNPFADLIPDTHAPTAQDTVTYTKPGFSHRIIQLEKDTNTITNPAKKAHLYYEMAKGLYQMSYWGNSWMLVRYQWGAGEGLPEGNNLLPEDKEYYGVYRAEEYYLKAFALSNDKNFKARCLFMAAKCDQKQLEVPSWANYPEYASYEKAMNGYRERLRKYQPRRFTTLVKEYSNTPFYKEAFNTCSYLKDFVKKMK